MSTDTCEPRLPTYRELAAKMNDLAESRGEWAGYPCVLPGMRLVLEPRYPVRLDEVFIPNCDDVEEASKETTATDVQIVSHRECLLRRGDVVHYREGSGKIKMHLIPWAHGQRTQKALSVLECCNSAWTPAAERAAMDKLRSLITPTAMHQYECTGMFIESSKRSSVYYVFRRLRPTIAIGCGTTGSMKILAALCLHPIGYYEGTWAGAMVPTDDLLAHLLMMRCDERRYWAKANQMPSWHPLAGIY